MFVRMWMTPNPVTVSTKNSVSDMLEIFQDSRFRLLPVLNVNNRLVGIVSHRDGLNLRPSRLDGSSSGSSTALLETTPVEAIMTPHPLIVTPLTPLEEAAQTMKREKIGGMPVVEDDKLVGIITESDIFQAFSEILGGHQPGVRLELIITRQPKAIYRIFDILKRHRVHLYSVAIHNDFADEQRLVTLKIEHNHYQDVLESIRGEGMQINSLSED